MRDGLLFVFVLLAAGCVGQGTAVVTGDLFVAACSDRTNLDMQSYDMHPDFIAGEPIEDINQHGMPQNRLELRIQASSGNLGHISTSLDKGGGIDSLFFSIRDVRAVATQMGQPIALLATDVNFQQMNPPPVRAALQLLGSCPFSTANYMPADSTMAGPSTLTFTRFGKAQMGVAPPPDFKVDFGEQIEAQFDLRLIDERFKLGLTGMDDAHGHLRGSLSLELRRGAAGQTFP